MIYTPDDLLKLILDTRAVSIWNHSKGPVFWYAANVPGPFYVNTEMVIGKELSERLLREITTIIAETADGPARADRLEKLILDSFKAAPQWQRLIATMADKAKKEYPPGSYDMVSGGERRDWLFSIPFAYVAEIPHLYLFKNGAMFSRHPVKLGQKVLHVSDLINNAASFFDLWQPILEKNKLTCCGNLCVTVRGENGLRRLQDAGQKVASLIAVDVDFFRRLQVANLISRETFEEIESFFASAPGWASKYLIGKPELFDVENCDEKKSFERLKIFVEQDPWKMRSSHEQFFISMKNAIDQRQAKKRA
ncbi:MAG: hypothetical protein PHW76_04460 [Alphaproteobacteria bacterium]|nr:hypothetical protein [Alphaproteobacteria bacterium]